MGHKTLYVGSENYGFGPTSGLFVILRTLQQQEITLRRREVMLQRQEMVLQKQERVLQKQERALLRQERVQERVQERGLQRREIESLQQERESQRREIELQQQEIGVQQQEIETQQQKIGQLLVGVDIVAVTSGGTNTSLEIFARVNPDVRLKLVDKFSPKDADLVFSSYDPFLIVEAWSHNKPTIFYCNLLWFWKVEGKQKKIEQYQHNLAILKEKFSKNPHGQNPCVKKLAEICEDDPNCAMYIAYQLAEQVFVRRSSFTDVDSKEKKLAEEFGASYIAPLIPQFDFEDLTVKEQIFFQLSGSQNLTSSAAENAIYVRFVTKFLSDTAKCFPTRHFVYCLNPNLRDYITNEFDNIKNVEIVTTLSQRDNQYYMRTSQVTFIPPGLCSLYELAGLQCPTFLLPEQNIGQHPNFLMLKKAGYDAERVLIGEMFLNDKRLDYAEASVIFKHIESLCSAQDSHYEQRYRDAVKRATSFIQSMTNEGCKQQHVLNNQRAVREIMGSAGPGQGQEITDAIQVQLRRQQSLSPITPLPSSKFSSPLSFILRRGKGGSASSVLGNTHVVRHCGSHDKKKRTPPFGSVSGRSAKSSTSSNTSPSSVSPVQVDKDRIRRCSSDVKEKEGKSLLSSSPPDAFDATGNKSGGISPLGIKCSFPSSPEKEKGFSKKVMLFRRSLSGSGGILSSSGELERKSAPITKKVETQSFDEPALKAHASEKVKQKRAFKRSPSTTASKMKTQQGIEGSQSQPQPKKG